MRRGVWAIVLAGLLPLFGMRAPDNNHFALRLEVAAELAEDGSLRIAEDLYLYFNGRSPGSIGRELIAGAGTDIVGIEATFDVRAAELERTGQVKIAPGNPAKVTWLMAPVFDRGRHFQLNYTVLHAAQPAAGDPALWRPLPPKRDYYIREVKITLVYPRAWTKYGQPDVLQGRGLMTREPGRLVFETSGITLKDDAIIISLPRWPGVGEEVPSRGVASPAPASSAKEGRLPIWQSVQPLECAWIWVWSSLILLGWGIYPLSKRSRPAAQPPATELVLSRAPPGNLPPALAGALHKRSARVTWVQAAGTLLDLAGRGFLAIDQVTVFGPVGLDYRIRLKTEPFDLQPHEESLLAMVLNDRHGQRQEAVMLSSLGRRIDRWRWRRWARDVRVELILRGLVKPGREERQRRMEFISTILTGLAVAAALVLIFLFSFFGLWPLVLVFSLAIAAKMWGKAARNSTALSDEGLKEAIRWDSFYGYIARSRPADEDEFSLYLPYAAAYGRLVSWSRHFRYAYWTDYPDYIHFPEEHGHFDLTGFVRKMRAVRPSGYRLV